MSDGDERWKEKFKAGTNKVSKLDEDESMRGYMCERLHV